MTLLAFGINHTTASLAVRERMAFAPEVVGLALLSAREHAGLAEVAILSTCNRTEIYVHSEQQAEQVSAWLIAHTNISAEELAQCYYCHVGDEAVRRIAGAEEGAGRAALRRVILHIDDRVHEHVADGIHRAGQSEA